MTSWVSAHVRNGLGTVRGGVDISRVSVNFVLCMAGQVFGEVMLTHVYPIFHPFSGSGCQALAFLNPAMQRGIFAGAY